MPRKKNARDLSQLDCQRCGCGIVDHEERAMQSMTGSFGCAMAYWHTNDADCVRALVDRVHELESLVAKQAVELDRLRKA